MIIGHVPGRCSTSFTNNLEHVTTFSKLDSFYRLDLNLPKKGINKICSHSRGSDFTLLLSLSRLKQIYQCLFASLTKIWKMDMKEDFFCLLWAQDYSTHTVEQPRVCLLHCCEITSLILLSQEIYSEDTRAMLLHYPGDFITGVEQFFSITITFKNMSFSV